MNSSILNGKTAVEGMTKEQAKGAASNYGAWLAYKTEYLNALEELIEDGMTEEAKQTLNQFLS